jgi:hypothetical protein
MASKSLTKLSHKHVAYILFRIGGYSNQETADILGYSVGTCINWGKDKLIREMRQQIEEDLRGAARNYLDHLLPEIVYTMADIMRNGGSERVRLDAASRLLDKALPAETIQKIQGDPTKPILYELLKTEEEKKVVENLADLTPEDKAKMAEALEQLQVLANSGDNTTPPG